MNKRRPKSDISVVSLFAGCGGLDLGFHEAGFNIVYAADNDPEAIAVYRHNIGPHAFVRDVTRPEFHAEIKAIGRADIVLGGFPCQGFSKAGPKRHHDKRNVLYREMLETVSILQPRLFVAENVDGLSQNFGGAYLRSITEDFTSLGYRVEFKIIDAVAYGVPQHRRRILFIGSRLDQPEFLWPDPTHVLPKRNGEFKLDDAAPQLLGSGQSTPRLQKAISIRDALKTLPALGVMADHEVTRKWPGKYEHVFSAIGPRQKLCNVRHADSSVYTWQIPQVFGDVSESQREILETIGRHRRHKKYGDIPNGNPLSLKVVEDLLGAKVKKADIASLLRLGYLKEIDGKYDLKGAMFCSGLFKRPSFDQPSPTVLTNFHNPRYFLHPTENRPFSLRECARLQGFPDSFVFTSAGIDLVDGYRLVGNAVPPPLSRFIAEAAKSVLSDEKAEALCAA